MTGALRLRQPATHRPVEPRPSGGDAFTAAFRGQGRCSQRGARGNRRVRHRLRDGLGLNRKLGLFRPRPDDPSLAQDLLERMASNRADFTLIFRRLCDAAVSPQGDAGVRSLFADPNSFDDWAVRWRHRLAEEGGEADERRAAMRAANPAFIPRNHLVEEAISAAVNDGNFLPFESLLTVLSMPYEDQPAFGRYVDPPRPNQIVHQTFCGT